MVSGSVVLRVARRGVFLRMVNPNPVMSKQRVLYYNIILTDI